MLIESIIQRPNGTHITLGSGADAADYHFRAGRDGRHVCEVNDQAHAALLLAIRDGFRSANPDDAAALAAAEAVSGEIEGPYFIFRGPQDLQAFQHWAMSIPDLMEPVEEYVLLIDKIAVGEASLDGHPASTQSLSDFPGALGTPPATELSPGSPADNTILPSEPSQENGTNETSGTDGTADNGADNATDNATDNGGEELDREALAKQYDELFGHRPNGRWSAEKIAQAIAEKQAEG